MSMKIRNQQPDPGFRPRFWLAVAAAVLATLTGFAAGYAPTPVSADSPPVAADAASAAGITDSTGTTDITGDTGITEVTDTDGTGALPEGQAAGDAAADSGAGIQTHRRPIIIIVRPGQPCYPYPCPGYPYPNPCYDPNFPPFPQPPVPPPPGATVASTPAPGGTPVPPTPFPMPSPTAGGIASTLTYRVCPQAVKLIPQNIQDLAVSEPWRYYGYDERQNPNTPYHPMWNSYRTWLSLRDNNQPYSSCNLPLWKSGCP
jgi:hypothetical protein